MIEPEEIIEAKLVALLAAALPDVDVIGALSPVPEGEQKLSPDTYVSVFVDQSGQPYWGNEAVVPFEFTARVNVRFANADDKTGAGFRDACRAVRAVLDALRQTHCTAFTDAGFICDALRVESTSTVPLLSGDNGGMSKTYNVSLTGRPTEDTTQEGD